MAKKQEQQKKGAPGWMTSYADFMSVLLCFFVLLYALADLDEARLIQFLQSFGNPNINVVQAQTGMGMEVMVGSGVVMMPMPNDANAAFEEIENYDQMQHELRNIALDFATYFHEIMEGEGLHDAIQIVVGEDEITLIFSDNMFFNSGQASLLPQTAYVLDYVAQVLAAYPHFHIEISGHTDNQPINTVAFPSNWELSSARALAVQRHFMYNHGMPVSRLTAIARGEYQPIADNATAEGRARNRRVEMTIRAGN